MIHGNEMVKVILALWEELPSVVSSMWQHGKSKEVMDSTKARGVHFKNSALNQENILMPLLITYSKITN